MEEIRRDYETGLWEDIGRFVNPRREDITDSSRTDTKGQRRGKESYDGTPLGALNTWADGMQGFLISKNWFKSQMDNPELNHIDPVRQWLLHYDRKMYSAFDRGNFYSVLPEWFRDAGSIGTATLYTEEVIGTGRIVHTCIHPREVFISEGPDGEVDTVHRKFEMTARNIFQKFEGKCSDVVKQNAEKHPEKRHEILHAVFPNNERMYGKKTKKNKPFRSIYMESKTDTVLRDSGYDMNPYAVWRFRKSSDEIYGRSPAADSLVEVFSLNQFGKTLMKAAQKSVDPPMNIPSEMRGRVRLGPSGNNYYDDTNRTITPINPGINYPVGIDQLERLQKSIEDKYRVEFFRAFIGRQGEATATEIMAIKGEQAGLMSAQVDRLYNEGIRKIFDVVSYIEDRRGAFSEEAGMPPIPEEIIADGGPINFLLTGPLAQALRRAVELDPIQRTLESLAPLAQMFGQEVLDVINVDNLSELVVESGNLPQEIINSKATREQMRQQRQEAIAQQQQQAMAAQMVKPIDTTKAPEEGSPVGALAQ